MNQSFLNKFLMGVAAIAMLAGFAGCNGGGSNNSGGGVIVIDPIVYAWYDVYGSGCATADQGPSPGCNYYAYGRDLVKIMNFEDPYFKTDYFPRYDTWTYYLNGVLYQYSGWAWLSPNGVLYDDSGNALNKKKGSGGRDMVRDVAQAEAKIVEKAGQDVAAKYNLSVSRGIQIARTLNDWSKIGKQRAKTEKDFAEFSQKLYGVDYTRVQKAVLNALNGDKAEMKATVADAAKNWGTNEETMKQVLKNWYHDQVPGLD